MMFAIMIEIVSMPRLGTGTNVSPLTVDAPRAGSSRHAALTRSGLALPPQFDPRIARRGSG
jgi:hypothetical protein